MSGKSAHQSITLLPPEEQSELYQKYYAMFDKFYTDDLGEFVSDVSKHDLLDDDLRSMKPAKLKQTIVDKIRDKGCTTFRGVNVSAIKRKVLKNGDGSAITEADKIILAQPGFDDDGQMRQYLEMHGGSLKLIDFMLGKQSVSTADYPKLHGNRMLVSAKWFDYGIYVRDGEQHSVMRALTNVNIVTNGIPSGDSTGEAFDFDDVLSEPVDERPAKKAKKA